MNRKLLEARPLKHTIDILLQVWFHLMGYVVHVYWLEVSKPDWFCALALVWFLHANKMRDPLSYTTIWHIFKVNATLFSVLKGTFHCFCSALRWTCNLSYRKFWINLKHPYGNHINLGLHQHYSGDRLVTYPRIPRHLKGLGVLGIGVWPWTSLAASPGVFTFSFLLFKSFDSFLCLPFFYTTSTLPSSFFFFYLVT